MRAIDTLESDFKVKIIQLQAQLLIMGIRTIVTSGRRTIAEQDKLYAQGRTAPGNIVTKAKGGQSPHNFGLAADLCPKKEDGALWWKAPDDVWNAMHRIGEQLGLRCGYDFKSIPDSPHYEDPNWKAQQALWLDGKIEVA